MKAMFGFLTPQAKETADPLQNAKTAAAWLRQLPALDVIGRQQHVIQALAEIRKSQRPIDLNRIGAIEFIDAALGADRRQLIKQYIENAEGAPKLAERIWQALWEMSQAFKLGYQAALETAVPQAIQVRALDPRQMAGAASSVCALLRNEMRPSADGVARGWRHGATVVGRAGISLRAARS